MTARDGKSGAFDGLAASAGAISFDLFGTLVTVEKPPKPDEAVASALRERDVTVPSDWADRYRTSYIDAEPLEEYPLHEHVLAALRSAASDPSAIDRATVADAVAAAFDTPIQTREGAAEAVTGVAEQVPVGILSNSSVEGLVERTIRRSGLPEEIFETIRSSVEIGWRKPHERAFRRVAADLGVAVDSLLHVGDDPRTDGAATRTGAGAVIVPDSGPLDLESALAEAGWLR